MGTIVLCWMHKNDETPSMIFVSENIDFTITFG